jgi:hypothetical protein
MGTANIKLVQDIYAAFGSGNVPGLLAGLSADIDWQTFGPAKDYPVFGPRKGPAGVTDFLVAVGANEDFSEFSPREFYAAADKVFVLGFCAGKMKKTGKPFACEFTHVFTVAGGKVSKFREYTDTAQFVDGYRG